MKIEAVTHAQLKPHPENVRRYFSAGALAELSDSIFEYGLLENLVVKVSPDEEGHYYIVGGERRYRAIGKLIKEGRWNEDQEVVVLIIDGEGHFENLVENTCREDVSPWDLGFRFNELVEAGYTQMEIGTRLGKGQGFVSRHINIARGLHPAVIDKLNRMPEKIGTTDLAKISSLQTPDNKPDKEAQLKLIDIFAGEKKGARKNRAPKKTDKQRLVRRVNYMRDEMSVPSHAQPYVNSILDYIQGKVKRIKFPEEI